MYSEGTNVSTFNERKNNMSFNCVYMNNNIAYVGADSRLTYENGEYNDSFQKLFVNKELKLIWSMTGLVSYKNIVFTNIINQIILEKKVSIIDKLLVIQAMINGITQYIYKETGKDSIFDLYIITIENDNLIQYTFESKNGYTTPDLGDKRYTGEHIEASGVHTEMKNCISNYDIYHLSSEEIIHKITSLIQQVIKIDKEMTHQTVGGDIYVATMDNGGNIKTYINDKEAPF